MPSIIGLDFGTTNTRVQLGNADRPDQSVAPIKLPGSDHDSLPTVILLNEAGTLDDMGKSALEALQQPESRDRVRYEFKPCLGRSEEDLAAQADGPSLQLKCPFCEEKIPEGSHFCGKCGKPLPEDYCKKIEERALLYPRDAAFTYAGLLLQAIGSQIRLRTLGGNWEPGDLVVVGVPVHWSEETRAEYVDLVKRTFGTDNVKAVCEPQAALAEYLNRQVGGEIHAGETVLVIDVGGGTTDLVAGVVREDGTLDREERYGIRFGGADFDDAVIRWAKRQLGCESSEGVRDPIAASLRPLCRELKEQLSEAVRKGLQGENPQRLKQVHQPVQGQLQLDRKIFESDEVAGPCLNYFRTRLADAVRQMGLRAADVNHVLLIGGGSNAYFVEDIVKQTFAKAIIISGQQPEMAVAIGLVVGAVSRPRVEKAPPKSRTQAPAPAAKTEQAAAPTPQPKSPLTVLMEEVESLVAQEQWDRALALFEHTPEAVRITPRFMYYRLQCLFKLGRHAELLQVAKGHENDHESIAMLVKRAEGEVGKERQARAAAAVRRSAEVLEVELVPEGVKPKAAQPSAADAAAHVARGRELAEKEQYDQAIEEYTAAIALQPDFAEAYLLRGKANDILGHQLVDSVADFTKAIELRPNWAEAYCQRGASWLRLGWVINASPDLTQAINLKPDYAEAYRLRSRCHPWSSKRAKADLATAVRLDPTMASWPDSVWDYYERGQLLYRQSRFNEAIADLTQAITLEPEKAVLYNLRSRCFRKKGNAKQADADRATAVRLNPAAASWPKQ